ncbi:hypothetical protein K438DRAFT_676580 [Mycena galopus ATCC 62051]|nr:hypothetical protein K438DRAFT_676580 [Mycena galopus ATCC 62051]
MTILNGTVKESSAREAFTSFQPLGCSVIDYCFVSAGLLSRIADGDLRIIKSPVWSDHAQVQTVVIGHGECVEPPPRRQNTRPSPIMFGDTTTLDILLEATLAAAVDPREAKNQLYGPVFVDSNPSAVYIGSSTKNRASAFAVWRGPESKANKAYMVDGVSTDGLAGILAVLCAVQDCSRDKSLVIYTTSQYIIRSFCYWAGKNETMGWTCANGDTLSDAVALIAHRLAPLDF